MIWLTWRQFRASAAAAAGALAVVVLLLAVTGPGLADDLADGLGSCRPTAGPGPAGCGAMAQEFFNNHETAFLAVTALVLVLPALVGLFWGAPLVARELEAGTHSLVWNQSVTRRRWLAVKLGLTGLAAMTVAGLGSLAVTWWASPLDRAADADFPRMEAIVFAARGVTPVGYAAFALTVGVAAGLVMRRTLPAMAVVLAVFVVAHVAMPTLVRGHLLEPVRETIEISDENPQEFRMVRVGPDRMAMTAGDSGAWLLSVETVDRAGRAVGAMELSPDGPCVSPRQDRMACYAEMTDNGYRMRVTYHPDRHFWPLQWIETAIYLGLAGGVAGFCFWRIRRLS